jgi:hypothetical protein
VFVGEDVVWAGEEEVDVFADGFDAFCAVLREVRKVGCVVFVFFVLFFGLLLVGVVSG